MGKLASLTGVQDPSWRKHFLRSMTVAFLLHLIAAYFSSGYYHTDEHFQILEFLGLKLGTTPVSDLAVEFHEKIRPWFQPGVDYLLVRTLQLVGVTSPSHWALVFRIYSSLLGFLSLCGLSVLSYSWFKSEKLRILALWIGAFLWFLPAFHARHSSENLSGAVFYFASSILFLFPSSKRNSPAFLVGLLFGVAFLFRYQVAFLVLGALIFYFFCFRPRLSQILLIIVGITCMTGLGVLIDHWGYGEWTFTPWNYFRYNLVLNHVSDVDTHPFWDFFRSSLTESFPLLGFGVLTAAALAWILRPLQMLSALTLPLYLIHSIIGHKELRFIFPIVHAAPYLILFALEAPDKIGILWKSFWLSQIGKTFFSFLVFLNFLALVPTTMLPVWMPARFFEQIETIKKTELPNSEMRIYYQEKDPFEILGIPMRFYRSADTVSVRIPANSSLNSEISQHADPVWFFRVEAISDSTSAELLPDPSCSLTAESLPTLLTRLLRQRALRPLTRRVTNWTLYRCERESGPSFRQGR